MPPTLGSFWTVRRKREINQVLTYLAAEPQPKREIMINVFGFKAAEGGPAGEVLDTHGRPVAVHKWNTEFFARAGKDELIRYEGGKYTALVSNV